MVAKAQTSDWNQIIGVLRSAHSIFKRYRGVVENNQVMTELKLILEDFQEPMLKIFNGVCGLIFSNPNDGKKLEVYFTALDLLTKIFYSLNFVDLPEYFEDHMPEYMTAFLKLLNYETQHKELVSEDDEVPGKLLRVQANICEAINVYASKYDEEFQAYLQGFVQAVWGMLSKASSEAKYDGVVTSAIKFLTSVAVGVHFSMFADPNALKSICEKILVPAMTLRDTDEEMFEDNPFEYIRADIEGSDTDTRRRSAVELVKGLRKHFETQITQIFSQYISRMIQEYSQDKGKWKAKDVAIYLITALSVKSAVAEKGATEVNKMVPLLPFFSSHILPELSPQATPFLQADALKFVVTFRLQIPPSSFPSLLPLLAKLLESPVVVVHTYAAHCIERLLTVKDKEGPRIDKPSFAPHVGPLLSSLSSLLKQHLSTPNQYVVKCVMRVISKAQEDVLQRTPLLLSDLSSVLLEVCKSPVNPTFNHYLFECISCLISIVARFSPKNVGFFEEKLFPLFATILNQEIAEFMPYTFQLLSQMLECGEAKESYWKVLPTLLAPPLWENAGNRPSLVRLLQAYISQGMQKMLAEKDNQGSAFMGVLGVWQKLNSTKSSDHLGFELLTSLTRKTPAQVLQPLASNLFTIIFSRLSSAKTTKYVRSFVLFLSNLILSHGPSFVITSIDALKDGIFENVLNNWAPEMSKFSGVEKKVVCVAASKLLCECPEMLQKYSHKWDVMIVELVKALEEAGDMGGVEEEADPLDTLEYTSVHAQLANASRPPEDPLPNVDPKAALASSLHSLSKLIPGQLNNKLGKALGGDQFQKLGEYFKKANVSQPYLA